MTKDHAFQLIKDVFESLAEELLVSEGVAVDRNMRILGRNSPLDSVGFVAFIADLEERLIQETDNDDIYLTLENVDGFDVNKRILSVDMLAQHIVKLVDETKGGHV